MPRNLVPLLFFLLALSNLSAILSFAGTRAQPSVCNRSSAVRLAIMRQVSGFWKCDEVSDEMLSQIRVLKIEWEGSDSPEPGDFNGMASLRSLRITDAKDPVLDTRRTLKKGVFAGLQALEHLTISELSLTEIEQDVFIDTPKLESLNLSWNHLSRLDPGIFRGLPALDELFLGGNPLTELSPGVFDGLDSLLDLEVSEAPIEHLDDDSFQGAPHLEEINLSHTALVELNAGPFLKLRHLSWIGVVQSKVQDFNEALLEIFPRHLKLDLTRAPLTDAAYCKALRHRAQVTVDSRGVLCPL